MLRVGLTGGIGCGKSTVASLMRELGCTVIDADRLAHEFLVPGQSAYDEIVREFGTAILETNGRVNRAKLAEIVFASPSKLDQLNRIIHPRVLQTIDRKLGELERAGTTSIAVVEAALLVEANYHNKLDRLVVVWCRAEQQRERLRARGLSLEEIERRIAAQIPLDAKRRFATDEIDNSETPVETRKQVERLTSRFKQLAASTKPLS
jgi:dephospho-CoA kinase